MAPKEQKDLIGGIYDIISQSKLTPSMQSNLVRAGRESTGWEVPEKPIAVEEWNKLVTENQDVASILVLPDQYKPKAIEQLRKTNPQTYANFNYIKQRVDRMGGPEYWGKGNTVTRAPNIIDVEAAAGRGFLGGRTFGLTENLIKKLSPEIQKELQSKTQLEKGAELAGGLVGGFKSIGGLANIAGNVTKKIPSMLAKEALARGATGVTAAGLNSTTAFLRGDKTLKQAAADTGFGALTASIGMVPQTIVKAGLLNVAGQFGTETASQILNDIVSGRFDPDSKSYWAYNIVSQIPGAVFTARSFKDPYFRYKQKTQQMEALNWVREMQKPQTKQAPSVIDRLMEKSGIGKFTPEQEFDITGKKPVIPPKENLPPEPPRMNIVKPSLYQGVGRPVPVTETIDETTFNSITKAKNISDLGKIADVRAEEIKQGPISFKKIQKEVEKDPTKYEEVAIKTKQEIEKDITDFKAMHERKMQELSKISSPADINSGTGSKIVDYLVRSRRWLTEAGTKLRAGRDLYEESNINSVYVKQLENIIGKMEAADVDMNMAMDAYNKIPDKNNQEALYAWYRTFVKPTFQEGLDLVRYNSMLSSPLTQMVNVTANITGQVLARTLIKGVKGGIDWMESKFTGKPPKSLPGEAGVYLNTYGSYANLNRAWKNFKDIWNNKTVSNISEQKNIPMSKPGTIGRTTENALSAPTRLLMGMDTFFQTLGQNAEKMALRYRQQHGGVMPKDILKESKIQAQKSIFNQELGEDRGALSKGLDTLANTFTKWRNDKSPLVRYSVKLTMPFIKIPTNITKDIVRYTPGFGFLDIGRGPQADNTELLAKQAIGTGLAFLGTQLASSDKISLGIPKSPEEKDMFYSSGRQAYSVKIGNKWVSFRQLHPMISAPLIASATLYEALNKGKISEDQAESLMGAFASQYMKYVLNQSYMKGANDFMDWATGASTSPGKFTANIVKQAVPGRAFLSWIERMSDNVNREAMGGTDDFFKSFMQSIAVDFPIAASQFVPAREDMFGTPIMSENRVINSLLPAKTTSVNKEMDVNYNKRQDLNKLEKIGETFNKKAEGNKITFKYVAKLAKEIDKIKNIDTSMLVDSLEGNVGYVKAISQAGYPTKIKNKLINQFVDQILSGIKSIEEMELGLQKNLAKSAVPGSYLEMAMEKPEFRKRATEYGLRRLIEPYYQEK